MLNTPNLSLSSSGNCTAWPCDSAIVIDLDDTFFYHWVDNLLLDVRFVSSDGTNIFIDSQGHPWGQCEQGVDKLRYPFLATSTLRGW